MDVSSTASLCPSSWAPGENSPSRKKGRGLVGSVVRRVKSILGTELRLFSQAVLRICTSGSVSECYSE